MDCGHSNFSRLFADAAQVFSSPVYVRFYYREVFGNFQSRVFEEVIPENRLTGCNSNLRTVFVKPLTKGVGSIVLSSRWHENRNFRDAFRLLKGEESGTGEMIEESVQILSDH